MAARYPSDSTPMDHTGLIQDRLGAAAQQSSPGKLFETHFFYLENKGIAFKEHLVCDINMGATII